MAYENGDPLIGKEIDGYKIQKLLGHGGMARVYRALDVKLQRYAAIKVVDPQIRNPRQYQERFDREARSIAKLKHPNIVTIYRFNEIQSLYYMAMEFIDGADLRWVLKDYQDGGERMDYDTVLQIVEQIAAALDYAHNNGVIHRDVKSSNIMIGRDGTAMLTDFGLALDTAEGSQGEIFGSPHYISPEQAINSASVTAQSDIYSLGVVLYEMLAGVVPYREGSTFDIAMAHINKPLPNPCEVNPNLHESFVGVLEKAMAKVSQNRYQTGAELVIGLRAAIESAKQAQPLEADGTRTRPAERIALRRAPLTPLFPTQEAKGLTPLLNMVVDEPQSSPEAKNMHRKRRNARRSRTPLLVAVGLLILIMSGYGIITFFGSNNPGAGVADTEAATGVIEGRVTTMNDSVLSIYDMPVLLDRNEPLLDTPELIGKIVRIEGRYSVTETGITFTRITSVLVDNAPLEESEQ